MQPPPAATTEPTPSGKSPSGTRRRRGVLSGVALVLACLTIVVATVGIWVHQVALNTDRFTALVTDVVAAPAVIDPVAARVSQQVITALDVQTRIANQLPGDSTVLARTITAAAQSALERQLQQVLADPRVQAGLLRSVSFTHAHLVDFLRGDTTAITIVDGYVQLNVFPVVGAALAELQSIGLIPADAQLPDLSSDEAPSALADRLESTLGITLPPDFGTVRLMEATRLSAAQTAVGVFDLIVVALVALSAILVALTLWLARDRRRMVIYLAIGTIIAFVVSRLAISGIASGVVEGIAAQGIRGALSAVVDATIEDLLGLTTIILIAMIVLLVAAYLAGRPAWLARLTSGSSDEDATA